MTGLLGWGNIVGVEDVTVSVVIPCYNAAPWLGQALDCLIAQTRGDWEAIVVDDGSVDPSADVAREYTAKDGRIRLIQQANGGGAAARNTGSRQARGRWLVFLDADDLLENNFLEAMIGAIEADPGTIGAVCDSDLFYENGARKMWPLPVRARRIVLDDILSGSGWTIEGALVERAVFEKIGGFDTTMKNSEDWDFWLRSLVHGEFAVVPQTLAHYRMHPAQKSRNYPRIAHHIRRVADKFREMYPEIIRRYGADQFQRGIFRMMIGYAWRARREGRNRQAFKIHMEMLSMLPPAMVIRKIVKVWTPLWMINAYRRIRGLEPIRDRFANEQP